MNHRAFIFLHLFHAGNLRGISICPNDHTFNRYIKLHRKGIIPFVVTRHTHDCPGPKTHQDKVRNKKRHLVPIQRVHTVQSGENTRLFPPLGNPFRCGFLLRILHILLYLARQINLFIF